MGQSVPHFGWSGSRPLFNEQLSDSEEFSVRECFGMLSQMFARLHSRFLGAIDG